RGRFKRTLVKISRPRRVGLLDAIGKQLFEQEGLAIEQADEDKGGPDVERDVKFGCQLCEVGLPCLQYFGNRTQEWRDQQHAEQPVDEIADRKTVTCGVVASRAFDQRVDSAAEIGAEHQGQ